MSYQGPWTAKYSAKAAEQAGSSICRAADGSEVEATCLTPVGWPDDYGWDDAEDRGIVVEWLRIGQKGKNQLLAPLPMPMPSKSPSGMSQSTMREVALRHLSRRR